MAGITVQTKRGRGRPITTGPGLTVGVRLYAEQLAALDAWIGTLPEPVSRPEAIRAIIAAGLTMLGDEGPHVPLRKDAP